MTEPSAKATIAAAKIIYAAGEHHGWWRGPSIAYEQLDSISRAEFDGIVTEALREAIAAQAVAAERGWVFPDDVEEVYAKPAASDLERAERLIEIIEVQLGQDFNGKESTFLKRLFANEIAEAVSTERERCAQIAEDLYASEAADAIRAADDEANRK